jgi:hypothetical protein
MVSLVGELRLALAQSPTVADQKIATVTELTLPVLLLEKIMAGQKMQISILLKCVDLKVELMAET